MFYVMFKNLFDDFKFIYHYRKNHYKCEWSISNGVESGSFLAIGNTLQLAMEDAKKFISKKSFVANGTVELRLSKLSYFI